MPDDTFLREEWWLFNFGQTVGGKVPTTANVDIEAPEAWTMTHGSPEVTVAVLDSGVDYSHPDLADRIWTNSGEMGLDANGHDKRTNGIDDDHDGYVDDWRGWDFVGNDNDPMDDGNHGTPVAGVIAADGGDGAGITGIAPGVKIMAIRAGGDAKDSAVRAKSIDYAAAHGAKIVVMAYATEPSGFFSGGPEEANAIRSHPDVLFVASSGNNGIGDLTHYSGVQPCNTANAPNLICVGATDQNDEIPAWSNMGASRVQLAAPGDNMVLLMRPRNAVQSQTFSAFDGWGPVKVGGVLAAQGPAPKWQIEPDPSTPSGKSLHILATAPSGQTVNNAMQLSPPLVLTGRTGCTVHVDVAGHITGGTGHLTVGLLGNDSFAKLGNLFGGNVLVQGAKLDPSGAFTSFTFDVKQDQPGPYTLVMDANIPSYPSAPEQTVDLRVKDWVVDCWNPQHSDRDYVYANGTSLSAPLTAGVAALVLSKYPQLTVPHLREALLDSAVKVPSLTGKVSTGGRLDAYRALVVAGQISSGAPPSPPPALTPGPKPQPRSSTSTSTVAAGSQSHSIEEFLDDLQLPEKALPIPAGRGKADPAAAATAAPTGGSAASGNDSDGGSGGGSSNVLSWFLPLALGIGVLGILGGFLFVRRQKPAPAGAAAPAPSSDDWVPGSDGTIFAQTATTDGSGKLDGSHALEYAKDFAGTMPGGNVGSGAEEFVNKEQKTADDMNAYRDKWIEDRMKSHYAAEPDQAAYYHAFADWQHEGMLPTTGKAGLQSAWNAVTSIFDSTNVGNAWNTMKGWFTPKK